MSKNQKQSVGISILRFIESLFMPIISKISGNRYINAIRSGMISIIPILLIGSTFMIIFFFPIGEKQTLGMDILLKENPNGISHKRWAIFLMLPYRLTYPMMGFFATIGISRALAKHYKIDEQQSIFIAIIAYILSIVGPIQKTIDNPTFTTASFGSVTIFGGFIVSIFSVEVFRLSIKYRIIIRLPKSVPDAVAKPFNAIIPMLLVMIPSVLLFNTIGFDIHGFLELLFSPIKGLIAGNNYFGLIIIILFVMILWIAGIHGMAIIGAIARPFWLMAMEANEKIAAKLGTQGITFQENTNILVEPFYQWFVWIGGAGATLGLIIAMLIVAKSKYIRAITYPSVVPGVFNINEPIIFGYPIVLNPTLAIPAIITPIITGTISFLAMRFGWVNIPTQIVGWTLPAPVGALLATGLDWKASVLSIAMILLSILTWWPFAKSYDNKVLNEEIIQEVEERRIAAKKENKKFDIEAVKLAVTKEFRGRSIFKKKIVKQKTPHKL